MGIAMWIFLGMIFFALFFWFLFVLVSYVSLGIVLTKLNRCIYGHGTPMAWLPLVNLYLLGKLTINKYVGWGIIICLFLTGSYSTEVNGVSKTYAILPNSIRENLLSLTNLFIFGLFIYAVFKYYKLEKQAVINNKMTMNDQVNNQEISNQGTNQTPINNLNEVNSFNNQNNNNINQ